jgi:hypothetical protein
MIKESLLSRRSLIYLIIQFVQLLKLLFTTRYREILLFKKKGQKSSNLEKKEL